MKSHELLCEVRGQSKRPRVGSEKGDGKETCAIDWSFMLGNLSIPDVPRYLPKEILSNVC